jgi:peptide/nickel transport system ATP-binding protein
MDLYRRMQLPNPDEIGFRYPHQVSGGQLQRAMTAMAMACRPDLIIFDEPTTALDVTTQIEVLAAIRDIVEQFDTAAIYITHDLAVVAQMADKIKVLLKGEEVEEADTRTMLDPTKDYTKSLWAVRSFTRPEQPPVEKGDPRGLGAQRHSRLRLHRRAEGHQLRHPRPSHRGRGGRIRVRQIHHGAGHHRPSAAAPGRNPVQRRSPAARLPPPHRDQLRQAQMIYQMADTALNPKLKLRDLIGRPAQMYLGLNGKALEDRIKDLLSLIELEPDDYIDRLPSELSGGQKQRIGIARALAAEPQFIICDEVTSALDQLVAEGILRLLDRLQGEFDLAYMFITHDLATVRPSPTRLS